MSEIEVGEHRYRTGRLDVFEQAKVLKRSAKMLRGIFLAMATSEVPAEGANATDQLTSGIVQITDALSEMSDGDLEYVLKTCMSKAMVWVGQGGGSGAWRPLMSSGNLMYEDRVDLAVAGQIAMETIQENLGPTLRGVLAPASGAEAAPSSSTSTPSA